MLYQRPQSEKNLSPEEKTQFLQQYFIFYENQAQQDINKLNMKIPREVFDSLLNNIGCMLLEESEKMAKGDPGVQKFLTDTPLPDSLKNLLPENFRVFCLMLNALKQWISKEQLATDRYLLGGTARKKLRSVNSYCLVTGETIGDNCELHHPVRDGRPPILLSKDGHAKIEGQTKKPEVINEPPEIEQVGIKIDDVTEAIKQIRKESNRSWLNLQNACLEDLDKEFTFSTVNVRNSSRSVLKRIKNATGLTSEQILKWIHENT